MRGRWRKGAYAKRKPARISEDERSRRRARMASLNIRMRDDETLKAHCVRGQRRVRRAPRFRAIQSAVMTAVMARPEMRRMAKFHCIKINKNPKIRKRQWIGRRKRQAIERAAGL
jgi:hypothetical protein